MINIKEFERITTIKNNDYGLYLETKTSICRYGQAYKKGITKTNAIERYLKFYYPLYIKDFKSEDNK